MFPTVAFVFAAFCVALILPRIWRSSGWTWRAMILTLVSIGVRHTVSKIWTAIKMLPADQPGAGQSGAGAIRLRLLGQRRHSTLLLIGLAAIVCGLMGTLVGISLSDVFDGYTEVL